MFRNPNLLANEYFRIPFRFRGDARISYVLSAYMYIQYCVFIDTMRTFAAVMIFERSIRISRRQALAYAPTSPGFYTFPCKTLFFVAQSLSFFQLFLPLNAKRK